MSEERYDPNKNQLWLGKLHNQILSYALPLVKDKDLFDAGSGSGWAEPKYLEAGAKSIDAFDIDDKVINTGNSLRLENVKFEVKDFNKSDFGESKYDVAISMEVIEHLTNAEYYFKNLVKALKPGGTLFLSTPNKKLSDGNNEFHIREYTLDEMVDIFNKNNLEIVKTLGVSTGSGSKTVGKYIPRWILEFIKKTPIYSYLVENFVKFPSKPNVEDAETIIYIGKKK